MENTKITQENEWEELMIAWADLKVTSKGGETRAYEHGTGTWIATFPFYATALKLLGEWFPGIHLTRTK